MKLEQVIIKNFRCYRNPISISIDALTAIIARNDVGKSSILEALDAFFNSDKLEPGDRSCGLRSTDSIEITCIFGEIPNQLIVDTDNLISPMNEYLLNNDNKLQIKKFIQGHHQNVSMFIFMLSIQRRKTLMIYFL
ncbi:AAA family ATPase [Klebsiella michiganensis]|nr:AAA family ATPase [Klebsiella michiganensis]